MFSIVAHLLTIPVENSPPDSEEGSEGDRYSQYNGMHNRTASVRTTGSMGTMASSAATNKPRQYFTHAGRVTVQPGEGEATAAAKMSAANKAAGATKPAAAAPQAATPTKKSRFSFGFGKKS